MKGRKWKRKGIIEKRRIFSFPIPFRLFEFWKKVPLGLYSEKKSRVLEREGSENSWVEKTFSTGKFSISKSVFYFRRCIHFSPACSEDGGGKKKKKKKRRESNEPMNGSNNVAPDGLVYLRTLWNLFIFHTVSKNFLKWIEWQWIQWTNQK